MDNMSYERDDQGIAVITWDMPGRSMNVLNQGSMTDFAECVEQAISDDAVRGILITSGKSTFMAGADLSMLGGEGGGQGDSDASPAERLYSANLSFNQLLRQLETCGKPVAAAINGTALGGGFEVCLACHYRVVADNPRSQLGLPECKVGVMPGGGGTQRLPRMIGAMQALPLILQGQTLGPQSRQEHGPGARGGRRL